MTSATDRPAATAAGESWGGQTWTGPVAWPAPSELSRAYDLAVRLEHGMTHHTAHPPFSFTLAKKHGEHNYPGGISSAMELVTMPGHGGTHVDAPGHISLNGCISEGRDVLEHQSWTEGLAVGLVGGVAPLIGPGHLVDGEQLFSRVMTNADGFGEQELDEWFSDRPLPQPGSIVLFRTGQMKHWSDSERYLGIGVGLPGVKLSGARWLSQRGVRAVGCDTASFEHKPEWLVPALDVHVHLLVEHGIPIMESVQLERLAADGVREFFLVATALRIGGGNGISAAAIGLRAFGQSCARVVTPLVFDQPVV